MNKTHNIDWKHSDDGASVEAKYMGYSLFVEQDMYSSYSSFSWVIEDAYNNVTIFSNNKFTDKENAKLDLVAYMNKYIFAQAD